jgi:hypothetical protein
MVLGRNKKYTIWKCTTEPPHPVGLFNPNGTDFWQREQIGSHVSILRYPDRPARVRSVGGDTVMRWTRVGMRLKRVPSPRVRLAH